MKLKLTFLTLALASAANASENCARMFAPNEWVELGTEDWRGLRQDSGLPPGWLEVGNGLMTLPGVDATDLVSRCEFQNFAFEFEWAVSPGGNGGVKYCVIESVGAVGLEYQVLDDENHPDGQYENKTAASMYDVYGAAAAKVLAPIGQFNSGAIVYLDGSGGHWLNGKQVVNFNQTSEDYQARYLQSKLAKYPHLQNPSPGRLLLQHHGEEVMYRNLRVMVIK